MFLSTFAVGVAIPDVEPADALHAFRYAQGARMTRLFDKLEGGLPVTVAAIGSSTTANGGAIQKRVTPRTMDPSMTIPLIVKSGLNYA